MKFYYAKDYQAQCLEKFQYYQKKIAVVLPHAVIEHIGSSAVDGLISKGDLDIYVAVPFLQMNHAIAQIQQLGFHEKLDTLRTESLCMLSHNSDDQLAIQVVAQGSEFEFFITFREMLRQSTVLCEQYNALKMSCEGMSEEEYRSKKAQFIEDVLTQHST